MLRLLSQSEVKLFEPDSLYVRELVSLKQPRKRSLKLLVQERKRSLKLLVQEHKRLLSMQGEERETLHAVPSSLIQLKLDRERLVDPGEDREKLVQVEGVRQTLPIVEQPVTLIVAPKLVNP